MLRKLFVAFIPALALLLAVPSTSQAQFKQKDWDFTLSGNGANDKDFETFSAAAQVGVGYFLSDQFEVGGRPGVVISDGGSQYNWTIVAFGDFHFDLGGGWVPFVGANIGYQMGGGDIDDSWIAGPEAGLKYFINGTTYVYGSAQYEFNLNEGFENGGFVYGLGLGVKL